MVTMNQTRVTEAQTDNPLLADWNGAFGVPPFARIKPEHFLPAFSYAFFAHAAEIAAIGAEAQPPTFVNTIEALERAGRALTRVSNVFQTLANAETSDAILAVERELAPLEARHWNKILMDAALFRRIDALYRRRAELRPDCGAGAGARALPRTCSARAGAALDGAREGAAGRDHRAARERSAPRSARTCSPTSSPTRIVLEGEDDLAGLARFLRARRRVPPREERGLAGKHVITLSRSSVEPFLQFSARRDLREKAFRAWIARGDNGGATDNKAIIAEMVALRAERARLLGYRDLRALPARRHHGEDAGRRARPARRASGRRRAARARPSATPCRRWCTAEGGNFALAPWDWRYYAEKLRKARFDLDEARSSRISSSTASSRRRSTRRTACSG